MLARMLRQGYSKKWLCSVVWGFSSATISSWCMWQSSFSGKGNKNLPKKMEHGCLHGEVIENGSTHNPITLWTEPVRVQVWVHILGEECYNCHICIRKWILWKVSSLFPWNVIRWENFEVFANQTWTGWKMGVEFWAIKSADTQSHFIQTSDEMFIKKKVLHFQVLRTYIKIHEHLFSKTIPLEIR